MKASLLAALERATSALDRGDTVAAARALEEATLACGSAQRHCVRLGSRDLGDLRAAYERCLASTERARAALGQAFRAAGSARRASDAYRR